ncbi:hypothetical protein FM120_28895 [Sphingobacterium faecium PCAi_F2.5]|nr:hypothetical protein FM120_28895 [Sphingobacterium faecium PCAi_F2.5]
MDSSAVADDAIVILITLGPDLHKKILGKILGVFFGFYFTKSL